MRISPSQLGSSVEAIEATVSSLLSLCDRWAAMLIIEHVETLMDTGSSVRGGTGGGWIGGAGRWVGGGVTGGGGADFVLMRLIEEYGGVVFLTCSHLDATSPFLSGAAFPLAFQV